MANQNPIVLGQTAPDFTLKDQRSIPVNLASHHGKRVLLSWHPLAWTPVCAKQMQALEANLAQLIHYNTVPLGLSVDPVPTKKAWAKELAIANLQLLADFWPHGAVTEKYGLFRAAEGFSERANIIVDENGTVIWAKVYELSQLPDMNEILDFLRSTH